MSITKTFEAKAECKSCGGTGLYIGFGEKNGTAVVCQTCEGTGCQILSLRYTPFTKRHPAKGVKQVFKCNPGICLGPSLQGGLSLKDWEDGKAFASGTELRSHTCPAWWYQSADYRKKPSWKECSASWSFCDCKYFEQKEACWKRFDKEQKR